MSEQTLKPCPFCGETLVRAADYAEPYFHHKEVAGKCIISAALVFDDEIAAWNARDITLLPAPPASPEVLGNSDEMIHAAYAATYPTKGHLEALRAVATAAVEKHDQMEDILLRESSAKSVEIASLKAALKTADERLAFFFHKDSHIRGIIAAALAPMDKPEVQS